MYFYKSFFSIASICLTGLFVIGCSEQENQSGNISGNQYQIICTVGMITDIARNVAGEYAQIESMIGEGVDPHVYKPTRGDVVRLTQADVIFYNGLLLEGKMTDLLDSLATSGKKVKSVTEAILEDTDYLVDKPDDSGQTDPHVWMDVSGWRRAILVILATLIDFDPNNAEVLCRLSAIARELGQPEEAIQAGERTLSLDPDSAEAHNNLGLALCDLSKYSEAVEHFEAALTTTSARYETLNNLGVAHQALGNLDKAEHVLRRALTISSSLPAAERNLGNVLRQAERFDEALSCYQRALKKNPLDFTTYANIGLLLINLNRPADAITIYEKALSLKPNHLGIRKSLGIAQLQCGNLQEGFRNYEARLPKKDCFSKIPRWFPNCNAHSVLVTAEQGFGDTLQFCRYLNRLVEMGLEVTFACQPTLVRLMRTVNAAITVISKNDKLPETDAHIPLLSLPFALKSTLETIPADCPYLSADAALTPKWRKITDKAVKSVGLVWSGNPHRQDDRMRSCPPELLRKLLCMKEIDFYSLQKEGTPTDLEGIMDLGSHLTDFAETAALINSLDIVVTVDTAMAHLAGALGKPVWVMLGNTADWRYFLERNDSPWYPQMRLFRQKRPGAWADLISDVAKALRVWAAA